MTPEFDKWLTLRAARGDERAFEMLLAGSERKLRNVCSSFADESTSLDDLYSIVTAKVWVEIQRGHFNPHRGSWLPFASTCAHQALRDDKQRRRSLKRWTAGAPPASYEALAELGWETPSWSLAVDPLRVVLAREAFAEAVATLTAAQLAAVNAYGATDEARSGGLGRMGEGLPPATVTAFVAARKRVRPLLFETMGRPLRLV